MAVPELKHWQDKRGRGRVTWKGRKGFPVMLRKGETPEAAYERTIAADAAKATEQILGATSQAPKGGAAPPPGAAPPVDDTPPGPRGTDPRPRGGKPAGKPRASDAELVKVWGELLTMPAMWFALPVHDPALNQMIPAAGDQPARVQPGFRPRCEFCRDHFLNTGQDAAAELVKLGEKNEPMRAVLERVATAWGLIATGGVLVTYLGKPILHHAAPEAVLDGIGPVLEIPPRPPSPPRRGRRGRAAAGQHDHGHAADPAAAAAGAA